MVKKFLFSFFVMATFTGSVLPVVLLSTQQRRNYQAPQPTIAPSDRRFLELTQRFLGYFGASQLLTEINRSFANISNFSRNG